ADDVDRTRLVEEAVDDLLVGGVLRVQELDRDARADHRVLGHVDRAHPALPQHLDHLVGADGAADQLVVGLDPGEIQPVLRTMEDLVVVLGPALRAGPGHELLRSRAPRTVEASAQGAVKRPVQVPGDTNRGSAAHHVPYSASYLRSSRTSTTPSLD